MSKQTKPPTRPAPRQEGLPHPDSVVGTEEFVSPKGRKYTILKTNEVDATDKPRKPRK